MNAILSQRPLTHYAWLSIAAALVTLGLKLMAWGLTGSVALLSDALESLVNLAAALLALFSLAVAARPADEEHAYGHTKAEYFASGMEGVLILLAALGIGWNAIERLQHPQSLESVPLGLIISGLASVINFGVARVLARAGRERHSVSLQADSRHLMTDVWTSLVVMLGVGLVSVTGLIWLDGVCGLLLSAHIIWMGVQLLREALLGLMDTVLPATEMESIRQVLASYGVQGVEYHALRTRQAGAWRFMSVHLLVPGAWTVRRAHELAECFEEDIRQQIPRITVLTHLEPLEDPVSWEDTGLERSHTSQR